MAPSLLFTRGESSEERHEPSSEPPSSPHLIVLARARVNRRRHRVSPPAAARQRHRRPGDSVVIAGTSHVIWKTSGAGSGPEIPAGASCHFEATYDLDIARRFALVEHLQGRGNDYTDPAAFSTVTGSRTLTADERAQATAAARAVKVSNAPPAERPTAAASRSTGHPVRSLYGDDFYACQNLYPHYVASGPAADLLGQTLDGMAHSP